MQGTERQRNAFSVALVEALLERSSDLAKEWLAVVCDRLPVSPRRIFPDATLLNHIPELLARVIPHVLVSDEVTDDPFVEKELRQLADLRRAQGYTSKEIVEEFQLLRQVVLSAAEEECEKYEGPAAPTEVLRFARRLQAALDALERGTAQAYVSATTGDEEERAELLSAFGRAITHELRNRLNNARLALDVYRDLRDKEDPTAAEAFERLESGLSQMEKVAADVFAAIVIEGPSGHAVTRRGPLDEILREVLTDIGSLAALNDVRVEVAGEVPTFQIDAARFQLVLVNLVNNAIKYADPTKPERTVRIQVKPTESTSEWRVDVVDNGIGIPVEFQGEVFARHVRLTEQPQGEGLGLALAREAAAGLGGRLWMTSQEGQGAKFSFTVKEPDAELTVNRAKSG